MKDNSHKNRTETLALVPFQCSTSICLSRPSGDRGGGAVLRTRAPQTPSFACLSSLRQVALFSPRVLIVCTALCARVFLRVAHLLVCYIVCRMLLLLYVRRRQQPPTPAVPTVPSQPTRAPPILVPSSCSQSAGFLQRRGCPSPAQLQPQNQRLSGVWLTPWTAASAAVRQNV